MKYILLSVLIGLLNFPLSVAQEIPPLGEVLWGACPFDAMARVKCGKITVPENRDDKSNGRVVTLSFAVIAASDENPAKDPVAFLTGGPGYGALFSVKTLSKIPFNETRDVIVLDPRGYGHSEPWLGCESVEALAKCKAEFEAQGIDVEQYSTANSVNDYEDLRKALGFEQWNLFGVSYGTYWASLYSRMHPTSLRSIIMDSPYPLNAGYDWNRISGLNGFERMFNACRNSEPCNKAYPNLRARFIGAMRTLKENPVKMDGFTLDHISAFQPIYGSLYISISLKSTPKLIDALAQKDYEKFMSLASQSAFEFPDGIDLSRSGADGLNASIMCGEDIFYKASMETRVAYSAPWPKDIVDLISPEGWDYDKRCGGWPVAKKAPSYNEPVSNDIPTVVIVGAYDPITPVEFGQAMLLHLNKGTLAVDPSTAHALFLESNACIHGIINRFFDNPGENVDTSCLMSPNPIKWDLP